jgi:hypothetical protein
VAPSEGRAELPNAGAPSAMGEGPAGSRGNQGGGKGGAGCCCARDKEQGASRKLEPRGRRGGRHGRELEKSGRHGWSRGARGHGGCWEMGAAGCCWPERRRRTAERGRKGLLLARKRSRGPAVGREPSSMLAAVKQGGRRCVEKNRRLVEEKWRLGGNGKFPICKGEGSYL